MIWRSSAAADECRLPANKRCNATKSNVPRSRSASSADGVADRRTLAAVHRESADARCPNSCWDIREASAAPRVDASTVPCLVRYGVC